MPVTGGIPECGFIKRLDLRLVGAPPEGFFFKVLALDDLLDALSLFFTTGGLACLIKNKIIIDGISSNKQNVKLSVNKVSLDTNGTEPVVALNAKTTARQGSTVKHTPHKQAKHGMRKRTFQ